MKFSKIWILIALCCYFNVSQALETENVYSDYEQLKILYLAKGCDAVTDIESFVEKHKKFLLTKEIKLNAILDVIDACKFSIIAVGSENTINLILPGDVN